MKNIKKIFTAVLLTCTTPVLAQSTLTIPDDVTIYVVNGQNYDKDHFIFSSTNDLKLPDGENQIIFKFRTTVKQGTDDFRTYDSDTIIAKFTINSTHARMIMPNYWTFTEAQDGIKNLSWQIKTDKGEQLSVTQDTLPGNGIQIARDYEKEVRKYNHHNGPAAISSQAALLTGPIEGNNENIPSKRYKNDDPELQATTSEMLKYWYQKADDKTKKQFNDYLKSQQ
ncbi:DUF2057 family protein [Klebsiella michiganensis]|uniref:DUF2057 family protein n=1 Tax=Klebsiella michiganensis TaxID=1134687 RepID=UPI001BA9A52F|nr:DUF2057 family protein [Klebsiella michiganensis]EKV7895255.1 DUF2057 family protein [Klebsiella michiganensis]ELS4547716.1 DUF2057 family protein [Klebsiella michiganensis]MBS0928155.1 DUF2057 family protein [Klebsiella michiganensis]MCW9670922.1 DUF2057 family protein [Klebsiella michiganensis]MDM4164143.1 DUF2057 family protein [Klebsiella michiganensis]